MQPMSGMPQPGGMPGMPQPGGMLSMPGSNPHQQSSPTNNMLPPGRGTPGQTHLPPLKSVAKVPRFLSESTSSICREITIIP